MRARCENWCCVLARRLHSFCLRHALRPRSDVMLCPLFAQAVFSIKPHHYPHAFPNLGDNYIEGFAPDKPVKKFFADK